MATIKKAVRISRIAADHKHDLSALLKTAQRLGLNLFKARDSKTGRVCVALSASDAKKLISHIELPIV